MTTGSQPWPGTLRPGALRWTRSSGRYADTVAFYRDLVGLPVIGEFAASFGSDGTIFGLPDTGVQLEIVRGTGPDRAIAELDLLVLYLKDAAAMHAAAAPLRDAGLSPDPEQHPYWVANGAVTYRDPDGRGVVFAPWVYGREPDPIDRTTDAATTERIEFYDGDRSTLRGLFEEAEDSAVQLDSYVDEGRVLAAWSGDDVVGHVQLIDAGDEIELKNMAVEQDRRGAGIGRRLVEAALGAARADGYTRMTVATAAADIGNLRFYQRCGFRLTRVEPDAFTPATGYPEPIDIDGIPLRDRVWLARELRRS